MSTFRRPKKKVAEKKESKDSDPKEGLAVRQTQSLKNLIDLIEMTAENNFQNECIAFAERNGIQNHEEKDVFIRCCRVLRRDSLLRKGYCDISLESFLTEITDIPQQYSENPNLLGQITRKTKSIRKELLQKDNVHYYYQYAYALHVKDEISRHLNSRKKIYETAQLQRDAKNISEQKVMLKEMKQFYSGEKKELLKCEKLLKELEKQETKINRLLVQTQPVTVEEKKKETNKKYVDEPSSPTSTPFPADSFDDLSWRPNPPALRVTEEVKHKDELKEEKEIISSPTSNPFPADSFSDLTLPTSTRTPFTFPSNSLSLSSSSSTFTSSLSSLSLSSSLLNQLKKDLAAIMPNLKKLKSTIKPLKEQLTEIKRHMAKINLQIAKKKHAIENKKNSDKISQWQKEIAALEINKKTLEDNEQSKRNEIKEQTQTERTQTELLINQMIKAERENYKKFAEFNEQSKDLLFNFFSLALEPLLLDKGYSSYEFRANQIREDRIQKDKMREKEGEGSLLLDNRSSYYGSPTDWPNGPSKYVLFHLLSTQVPASTNSVRKKTKKQWQHDEKKWEQAKPEEYKVKEEINFNDFAVFIWSQIDPDDDIRDAISADDLAKGKLIEKLQDLTVKSNKLPMIYRQVATGADINIIDWMRKSAKNILFREEHIAEDTSFLEKKLKRTKTKSEEIKEELENLGRLEGFLKLRTKMTQFANDNPSAIDKVIILYFISIENLSKTSDVLRDQLIAAGFESKVVDESILIEKERRATLKNYKNEIAERAKTPRLPSSQSDTHTEKSLSSSRMFFSARRNFPVKPHSSDSKPSAASPSPEPGAMNETDDKPPRKRKKGSSKVISTSGYSSSNHSEPEKSGKTRRTKVAKLNNPTPFGKKPGAT